MTSQFTTSDLACSVKRNRCQICQSQMSRLIPAREKIAHMIMNGALLRGANRPSVHPPIEPSADALRNPAAHAAYQSSIKAALEAYLSGADPTRGSIYLNMPVTADRSNLKFPRGLPQGVPINTQSGPYNNSFPNVKVPSNRAWVNTYAPE